MKYNKFIILPCVSLCIMLFGCNKVENVNMTEMDIQRESLYIRNSTHSYSTNNIGELYNKKVELEEKKRLEEEQRLAEEKRLEEERLAEEKRLEEEKLSNDNKVNEENSLEITTNNKIEQYEDKPYTPNTIGINGIFKSFTELGNTTYTPNIQSHLNNGEIVASLTYYSSDDGQTTYFSGHNPGVFNYMYENIYIGAVITVVDRNGKNTDYIAVEGVYVDKMGETYINSIGDTAINLYNYGSNRESIAIQYCLGNTMMVWYCEKQ